MASSCSAPAPPPTVVTAAAYENRKIRVPLASGCTETSQGADDEARLQQNIEIRGLSVSGMVANRRGEDGNVAGKNPGSSTTLPRQWNELFRGNREPGKCVKLTKIPGIIATDSIVEFEDSDIDSKDTAWGFSLVGFFVGRFLGGADLQKLQDSWGVNVQRYAHPSGWHIFKFLSEDDKIKVLSNGPYSIFGRAFILKDLPELFDCEDAQFGLIPTWVQLPGLPLEYWNVRALSRIASWLGNPIMTDVRTAEKNGFLYARILVEIDATKELIQKFDMRLPNGKVREQKVIFEGDPKYCVNCKKLGHSVLECKGRGLPNGRGRFRSKSRSTRGDRSKSRDASRPRMAEGLAPRFLEGVVPSSNVIVGDGKRTVLAEKDNGKACALASVQFQMDIPGKWPPLGKAKPDGNALPGEASNSQLPRPVEELPRLVTRSMGPVDIVANSSRVETRTVALDAQVEDEIQVVNTRLMDRAVFVKKLLQLIVDETEREDIILYLKERYEMEPATSEEELQQEGFVEKVLQMVSKKDRYDFVQILEKYKNGEAKDSDDSPEDSEHKDPQDAQETEWTTVGRGGRSVNCGVRGGRGGRGQGGRGGRASKR